MPTTATATPTAATNAVQHEKLPTMTINLQQKCSNNDKKQKQHHQVVVWHHCMLAKLIYMLILLTIQPISLHGLHTIPLPLPTARTTLGLK